MGYNRTKTDAELGKLIHQHLLSCGVETPTVESALSRSDKIEIIETKFADIMRTMGLDLTDDSLAETPLRVAKMFVGETMWGLDWEAFPKCTTVDNKMGYDEMVIEKNVTIKSNCEHHFVPIVGLAHVAYIPNKKVLGLSKIPRIVEYFSRRPQIQERLTEQVYHAMQYILETDNVAVVMNARHLCVSHRGVEDTNASTVTSKLGGVFKTDPSARAEFLNALDLNNV
jgi:GTP cyclohydrolase IA